MCVLLNIISSIYPNHSKIHNGRRGHRKSRMGLVEKEMKSTNKILYHLDVLDPDCNSVKTTWKNLSDSIRVITCKKHRRYLR